jgi:uncharacterized protein YrrD
MNSKQIHGLAVVSIADGAKVGTIDRIYLDPVGKQIVGFAIKPEGARLSRDTPNLIDVDDVHSLGPDALTLSDTGAVRGDRTRAYLDGLVATDDLTKRKVVTEGGTYVGEVADLEFADGGYALTGIEVSPGFFKSNKLVPTDQIVNIGAELVMVSDAVCAPEGGQAAQAPPTEGRFVVGDVAPNE